MTGEAWKVSHHNDWGYWRTAMTREHADKRGGERVVLDHRPRPAGAAGWSEGIGVLVPCAYLRAAPKSPASKVVRIPTSPKHSAVAVRLLFEDPDPQAGALLHDAFPVAVMKRINDGRLYVAATSESISHDLHVTLAKMCADASASLPSEGRPTRFVGMLGEPEGQLLLVDLVVD